MSKSGIHWHIRLRLFARGRQVTMPANIGIGPQYRSNSGFDQMMGMTGIHTHDASGTIHWELMAGPTKRSDVRLGSVFGVWGQPFSASQLGTYRAAPGERVTMTVNGQPNLKLGRYEVHDGDEIDIRLEKL